MKKSAENMFSENTLRWMECVLEERFGQCFDLTLLDGEEAKKLELSLAGQPGAIMFDRLQEVFHESRSDFPFTQWIAEKEGFVSALGQPIPMPGPEYLAQPLIEQTVSGYVVHYDLLGLTYWMLTRLEEIGRTDLDNHNRFPATSSHAFKHGYLERPVVDEWLDILGQVIERQWPNLSLKQHRFSMKVSHDVDGPAHYGFQGFYGLICTVTGDVLKRGDFKAALLGPWIWLNSKENIHPKDPANTFDWIMDQSEKNGLTSAFYFICGRTDPAKDALYEPETPAIRKLMRRIHGRGHEIGLHPSYNTYQTPELIEQEANRLRRVCHEEGITQTEWGGRMHFLRWDQALTLKAWDGANMSYDSTLSYADRPGFRCGTCHEYPAFDLVNDKQLNLRIRPLVAMDCTVIADRYLGLGSTEQAYDKFYELKENCRKVGGVFTLLWHNSFFSCDMDFEIYRRLVSEH